MDNALAYHGYHHLVRTARRGGGTATATTSYTNGWAISVYQQHPTAYYTIILIAIVESC